MLRGGQNVAIIADVTRTFVAALPRDTVTRAETIPFGNAEPRMKSKNPPAVREILGYALPLAVMCCNGKLAGLSEDSASLPARQSANRVSIAGNPDAPAP